MKQYNRLIRNNGQYTDPTFAKASKKRLGRAVWLQKSKDNQTTSFVRVSSS